MAWQAGIQTDASPNAILSDVSSRTFMNQVYRWMFAGLAVTGGLALYTATNVELATTVARSWTVLALVELGLVMALSWGVRRLSAGVAATMFLAYAALNGLTLSGIFFAYRLGSVAEAFFVTAGAYGALSVYGAVTKKDLSAWASFLFIGLIGVVLSGLVNLFVHSEGLSFVSSCAAVVVFGGLTAYDNQKLRALHASGGYAGVAGLPILGALTLYLDFINLFLSLLRLMGRRRN